MVKVARPKRMGCLWRVDWVGVRAQGIFSEGPSDFSHVRQKRVSEHARAATPFSAFFHWSWSMSLFVMSVRPKPPQSGDFGTGAGAGGAGAVPGEVWPRVRIRAVAVYINLG